MAKASLLYKVIFFLMLGFSISVSAVDYDSSQGGLDSSLPIIDDQLLLPQEEVLSDELPEFIGVEVSHRDDEKVPNWRHEEDGALPLTMVSLPSERPPIDGEITTYNADNSGIKAKLRLSTDETLLFPQIEDIAFLVTQVID